MNRLNQLKPGDHQKILENIDKLSNIPKPTEREKEMLEIFNALDAISNNDYPTANEQVAVIWDRLKKHDTWYLYDIRLIKNREFQTALDTVEDPIRFSMDHSLHPHLAASYVRKGIILKNLQNPNSSEWYEKGFDLLEIIHNKK